MKWSEHVRALSRLSSGSPLICSPVFCPWNQWPSFQYPLSSPPFHMGTISAFVSLWLFKIQYAACQDWLWRSSLMSQTWGCGCATVGEDPNLPMQLLPPETRAGERCRIVRMLPAAGYEAVQKCSWCVCCFPAKLVWIDMGCVSKRAVLIHFLTLNSGPGWSCGTNSHGN